jgi:hypothetical protein
LGDRSLTAAELGAELQLHPQGTRDFFDALVAMHFLEREGDGELARYRNTSATALYLDQKSPRYIGGILAMLNERLFKFWHDLPQALQWDRRGLGYIAEPREDDLVADQCCRRLVKFSRNVH